jgi:hypothetical protein
MDALAFWQTCHRVDQSFVNLESAVALDKSVHVEDSRIHNLQLFLFIYLFTFFVSPCQDQNSGFIKVFVYWPFPTLLSTSATFRVLAKHWKFVPDYFTCGKFWNYLLSETKFKSQYSYWFD